MERTKVEDFYSMMRTDSLPAASSSPGPLTPKVSLETPAEIMRAFGRYTYAKVRVLTSPPLSPSLPTSLCLFVLRDSPNQRQGVGMETTRCHLSSKTSVQLKLQH